MRKMFVIIISLTYCLSVWSQEMDKKDQLPLMYSEKMPSYPEGESEMLKFIQERLFYPWVGDSIKGRVVMRFVIDKDGDVGDISILRGLNSLADTIATNIVRQMPRWNPGSQDGTPVPVYFTLPITFNPAKIDQDKKLNIGCMMPTFSGGDNAMYKFISENLKYPNPEATMQGKVIVRFIVDSHGKIHHPHILRTLCPYFNKEIIRVISLMPDFVVPKGYTGCYLFTLPIIFMLDDVDY